MALTLRDGTTIYADVFRPETDDPVPAIVNWAPYGKAGTGFWSLDNKAMFPNRFGIKRSRLSGLESWEGNDPGYWCAHGYAVVQVDARGVFNSEGSVHYLSSAEGRDGHDAVEGIAALPWCTGRIGLAGNSWLAMSQWRTASEQPAHLAAIAPWEGLTDLYRDVLARGGVPAPAFPEFIRDKIYGRGEIEDPIAMLAEHPVFDEYWDDKLPDIRKIDVPAYVVASYTNRLHTNGTLRNWAELKGQKWLRIHNSQEWPDFYAEENVEDLRRFFDHFLQDVDNSWEKTPPVRLAVLDPGRKDTVNRAEQEFPPQRVQERVLYLNAGNGALSQEPLPNEEAAGYQLSHTRPHVDFVHQFNRTTEVIGQPVLTLHVEIDGHHDADLWVQIQKLDSKRRQVWHQTVTLGFPLSRLWMPLLHRRGVKHVASAFHSGPEGVLRLSRRGIDRTSPKQHLRLSLESQEPIQEGEVIEAVIPLWPTGMRWHEGEYLQLRIAPQPLAASELPGLPEEPMQEGKAHIFHTGAAHASRLVLPIVEL